MEARFPHIDLIVRTRLNSYVSPKVEIGISPVRGRGLFVTSPFHPGEVALCHAWVHVRGYVFARHSLEIADPGPLFQRSEIQIADNLFIGAIHPDDCMIASNHSCEPNTAVQGQIVFVAVREIAAGEELAHDWATTDDAMYAIECRCGSAACRRIITGKD